MELDSKNLGRLRRVADRRKMWTPECGDFTPWRLVGQATIGLWLHACQQSLRLLIDAPALTVSKHSAHRQPIAPQQCRSAAAGP
jgi:hypothetical protein